MNLDELLVVAAQWARWTYPEVTGLDDAGIAALIALQYPGGWTEFLRRKRRRNQTKFPSEGRAWILFAERFQLAFANGLLPASFTPEDLPPIAVR